MQSSIEKNLNENSRENDEMINSGLKKRLLFDGENYYLVRSLNRNDIENFDRSNGIVPKIDSDSAYTVSDQVSISQAGKDFQIAKNAVSGASDIREDKVAQLKSMVDAGTYSVEPGDFASKLLEKYNNSLM